MTPVKIMACTTLKGKARLRSIEGARAKVKDGELYLIRRNGGYFRPEAMGYTDELSAAGVFKADVARTYLDVEGVSVVHLDAMRYAIISEITALDAKAMRLKRMRALTDGAGMSHGNRAAVCRLVVENPDPSVTRSGRVTPKGANRE